MILIISLFNHSVWFYYANKIYVSICWYDVANHQCYTLNKRSVYVLVTVSLCVRFMQLDAIRFEIELFHFSQCWIDSVEIIRLLWLCRPPHVCGPAEREREREAQNSFDPSSIWQRCHPEKQNYSRLTVQIHKTEWRLIFTRSHVSTRSELVKHIRWPSSGCIYTANGDLVCVEQFETLTRIHLSIPHRKFTQMRVK